MSFPQDPPPRSRGARTVQRILDSAARIFGRDGFQGASMNAVARAAGVSKALLHYHFRSKEHLLIEAQRATFRQLHKRFDERFGKGEKGLATALDALDSLYDALREMRALAPFMVETMSLVTQGGSIGEDADHFYAESMELLENGIRRTFEEELDDLALPPDRLAQLVRICVHGLLVELAYARTDEELAVVDRSYRDLRASFERIVFRTDA